MKTSIIKFLTKNKKKLLLGLGGTIFIAIVIFLGITILILNTGYKYCYNQKDIDKMPSRHAALVLGCSIGSGLLNWRCEAAAQLYHHNKVKVIIVSGDNRRLEYNEPAYMKKKLISLGVPAEKIFCDYAGFRTLDSVIRAKEIFSQDDFIVVSQYWHSYRAVTTAHGYKMKNVIGYNAQNCKYYRYLREPPRESLARILCGFDILIRREPYFYGEKVDTNIKD